MDFTSNEKRPLVAVGYGPRCVPVMQLTEAAARICDLLWLIDGSIPEMAQMTDLLNRFGPVVDISGLDAGQILEELVPPYKPDVIATYLDANMTTFAQVAAALRLPFHSVETAVALTDKYEQRRVLGHAGLPVPPCEIVTPEKSERGSGGGRVRGGLARRSQAPLGPGEPLHVCGQRRRAARPPARLAGADPPGHGPRGIPGGRPGAGGGAATRPMSRWRASPRRVLSATWP